MTTEKLNSVPEEQVGNAEDAKEVATQECALKEAAVTESEDVVENNGEEILIPAQEELIAGIDHDGQTITFDLPEGLVSL